MLRTLDDFPVDSQQVPAVQRLESKVIVGVVARHDDGSLQLFSVVHDDLVGLVGDQRSALTVDGDVVQVLHCLYEAVYKKREEVRRDAKVGREETMRVIASEGKSPVGCIRGEKRL